jgi:hypothetical protein
MTTNDTNIPNAGLGNYLGLTVLSKPYPIRPLYGHHWAIRVRTEYEHERFTYEQYFHIRREAERWLREHHAWTTPQSLT